MKKRLNQPRVPGLHREPAWSTLDPRIKREVTRMARHYNVSISWLVATLLADAVGVDLEKPMRAYSDSMTKLRLVR